MLSFDSVIRFFNSFTENEAEILIQNVARVKFLLPEIAKETLEAKKALETKKVMASYYVAHMDDKDVPKTLKDTTAKWRKFASDLGYEGPVVWQVREGFTLKNHAPVCYESFEWLKKDIVLKDDKPTESSFVFWIPSLVDESVNKGVDEQMALLAETRKRYGLPEHHLSNFGSAALIAALMFAHLKRTEGEHALKWQSANTDTFIRSDINKCYDGRLYISHYERMECRNGGYYGHGDPTLGVFPLGIELI